MCVSTEASAVVASDVAVVETKTDDGASSLLQSMPLPPAAGLALGFAGLAGIVRSTVALEPVALCALAKGRRSGEEALWIPALSPAGVVMGRRVEDAHDDAMKLLRAVRDSAHAVAIGAHRSLRREERLSSFVA